MTREVEDNVKVDLAGALGQLARAPRYKPGPPCGVGLIVGKVTAGDAATGAQLQEAIDNPEASATRIAELLAQAGHRVAGASIARHRRRGQHNGCRCAP